MTSLVSQSGKLIIRNGTLLVTEDASIPNCCCDNCYGSITIDLCIDGSDTFILKGTTLTTEHRNFFAPGKHPECPSACLPTKVNGVVWDPYPTVAVGDPGPYPNPQPFDLNLIGETFENAKTVFATGTNGRTVISVVQQPNAGNGFEAKILVDDDGAGGPVCETVKIEWTCEEVCKYCVCYRSPYPNCSGDEGWVGPDEENGNIYFTHSITIPEQFSVLPVKIIAYGLADDQLVINGQPVEAFGYFNYEWIESSRTFTIGSKNLTQPCASLGYTLCIMPVDTANPMNLSLCSSQNGTVEQLPSSPETCDPYFNVLIQ